jgi:uncharacterized cupin superfamily protein
MNDALRLMAGQVTDASGLTLDREPVPAGQLVAGAPETGHVRLDDTSGVTVGVWEMTPGAMRDVEADELFVVLAGDATVEFEDAAIPTIELRPGSVVRLEAGMRTIWTVRDTLRKVYLAL